VASQLTRQNGFYSGEPHLARYRQMWLHYVLLAVVEVINARDNPDLRYRRVTSLETTTLLDKEPLLSLWFPTPVHFQTQTSHPYGSRVLAC